jgi:hypothetical protein
MQIYMFAVASHAAAVYGCIQADQVALSCTVAPIIFIFYQQESQGVKGNGVRMRIRSCR